MHSLSKRLSAIAEFVRSEAVVCDIGTDHGYLAAHLVRSGTAKRVIAADINEKPLENARKNLSDAGISDVELRLCDGLSGIAAGEADTVVIAGMGGEVIAGILERGRQVSAREDCSLILQPTTSPEFLRRFLYGNGYEILTERPIFENGKVYSVILSQYSGRNTPCREGFYYIGKVLPTDSDGLRYIKKQQKRCESCMQSLEGIPLKETEYLKYKAAFLDIKNYLKSFNLE